MNEDNNQANIPSTNPASEPVAPAVIEGGAEIEPSEEEQELSELIKPFKRFPKLKKWTELFLDKNNPKTYGNRTESAMQAYNCKDRLSASAIGVQNFRKLRGVMAIFADDKGITIDKVIEVTAARALTSDSPEWMKLFTSMTGIYDPKAPQLIVNNNTQNNTQINIASADQVDFNKAFKDFVSSE